MSRVWRLTGLAVLGVMLGGCEVEGQQAREGLATVQQVMRAQQIYAQSHKGKYTPRMFDLISIDPRLEGGVEEDMQLQTNSDRTAYRFTYHVYDGDANGKFQVFQPLDSQPALRCENIEKSICAKGRFKVPPELTRRP